MKEIKFQLDAEKIEKKIDEAESTYFESNFSFLKEHNGLRKGKLHLILGTAGGGKSTLVRSMVNELLSWSLLCGKVMVWLSEESASDLEMGLYKCGGDLRSNTLHIFSEIDQPSYKTQMIYLEEYVRSEDPDVVVIDNLTTSQLYEGATPKEQLAYVKFIKTLSDQTNVPFVLIAHTGAEITENTNRLINMNDIRGTKNVVNLVEYLYLLQRFKVVDEYFPTIRIAKSRGHVIKSDIHKLVFNSKSVSYDKSFVIPFEEFKKAFRERLVL